MEKHKKHVKHAHKNWVGIFAAAFAVAVVVATQIGGVDSEKFKADMASDCAAAGGTYNGTMCQMPGQQDPGVACANSGGTWNGTMCNMPNQTACGSGQYWNGSACVNNTPPTCPSGQYWNGSMCANNTAPNCTSPMYLDTATNTCKSPTNTACPSGQYWNGSMCANNTTGSASSYITDPTCAGAGYFWSFSKNMCFSTQADKTAAEAATGATTCPAGQYLSGSTCIPSPTPGTQNSPSRSITWNALGVTSWVCSNAPDAEIEARKLIVKDLTNAQVFWPNGSDCTRTDKRAGFPEKGSSTTGTTNCGAGMYWDTVKNMCSSTTTTTTVDTVGGCDARGMGWDAANSKCVPRDYSDTSTWDMPAGTCPDGTAYPAGRYSMTNPACKYSDNTSSMEDGCRKAGGVWMPGVTMGGTSTSAMRSGYCKMSDRDMPVDTIGSCESRGMGWDAERSMCSGYKNIQTEWDMSAGMCPDGTSYKAGRYSRENPPCSMENTRAMGMEEGCRKVGGTWVAGTESFTHTGVSTMGYCRMPIDLKVINETNARMKAECVARKGTWNPGPTETATGWCRMSREFVEPEVENCGEDGYWDFHLQSCQTRETEDMFRGDMEDRESMRMMTMFKRQLSYIARDVEQVRQRAEEMTENGVDASEALDYLDRAEAIVTNMMENLEDLVSAEDPRTLFEPECMQAVMRNTSFNAEPQRMCSIEEALEGDTPRGYIYAANMILEEARNYSWETKKCENLAKHLAEAQRMFAKAKNYKAEIDALLVEGNNIVARCDAGEDIDEAMEDLSFSFEDLMRRSSKKAIDPSYGLRFSGVDQRMDEETFNRVVALRVNEEISARLKEVIDERMSELATYMDAPTLAKVTAVFTQVKKDISDKLAASFENAAVFAKRAPDAVNRQQGYVVDTINTLKTIETLYPRSAGQVEKVRALIASRPWPSTILSEWNDIIARALAVANTDNDPSETLGEILSQAGKTDEVEVNRKLTEEGLWASPYLRHDVWYAAPVNEAYTRRVMEGTVDAEGNRDFRPEVPLNCIEGTAMIYKAAGKSEPTEIGEFARTLAGSIEWSRPFVEGTAAIIGEDELRGTLVDRCGGIGESMKREVFAHLVVQMYEKLTGKEIDVDVDQEIAGWTDKDQLGDYKLDLAKAHKLGVITGANGGVLANPKGVANRAEAAKMLTAFNKALETLGVLATPENE